MSVSGTAASPWPPSPLALARSSAASTAATALASTPQPAAAPAGTAATSSASPATGSPTNAIGQFASDLQALLLQLQGGGTNAAGPAGATSGTSGATLQDGDGSAAASAPGSAVHHRHPHARFGETDSPDAPGGGGNSAAAGPGGAALAVIGKALSAYAASFSAPLAAASALA